LFRSIIKAILVYSVMIMTILSDCL